MRRHLYKYINGIDRYPQIFTSKEFPCAGTVEKWEFYAVDIGKLYLSVWRPSSSSKSSWTCIGTNMIDIHRTEINHTRVCIFELT